MERLRTCGIAIVISALALSCSGKGDTGGGSADSENRRNGKDDTAVVGGHDTGPRASDVGGADSDNPPPLDSGRRRSDSSNHSKRDSNATDDASSRQPMRTKWPRGLRWVRNNPMFISALNVQMGKPPSGVVNDYYDAFHANAIHLWATGLPNELGGWLGTARSDHRWVSWVKHDGTSADGGKLLGGMSAGAKGRIGYQVGDEPRSWKEYQQMLNGVQAVRSKDPNALVYLNMSYLADDFERMLKDMCNNSDIDLYSYDRYSRSQSEYETLETIREWGLKCDKPYWRYLEAYENKGESDWPTESDMRWDAFVGLVYGFTGHTWFLYQVKPNHDLRPAFFTKTGDFGASRTKRFGIVAQINEELANYGRVVTRLTSTDVRYISDAPGGLTQPDGTSDWQKGAGNDPYIVAINASGASVQDVLIGFFHDNYGERYVMFQNVNHSSSSFGVGGDQKATIELTFDFSSAPGSLDKTKVEWLDPTDGSIDTKALSRAGGNSKLSVTLDAGNAFLFKYANGKPWAKQ